MISRQWRTWLFRGGVFTVAMLVDADCPFVPAHRSVTRCEPDDVYSCVTVPVALESAAEVPSPKSTLPDPSLQLALTRVTPFACMTSSVPDPLEELDSPFEPREPMTATAAPADPGVPGCPGCPGCPCRPG